MIEHLIKTIHKVRWTSRYIEFWFKEDLNKRNNYTDSQIDEFFQNESFDASMKLYDFFSSLEYFQIFSDVLTSGLENRKTIWKRSNYDTHWEFVGFVTEKRMVLIEKI